MKATRFLIRKTLVNSFFILIITVFSLLLGNSINIAYANSDKEMNLVGKDKEKDWGIQVLSMRQTAAGYMLDFRYKVIDPEKAALFLDKRNKPILNILKSGLKLQVPVTAKIGPLRQSARLAKAGKTYFMFFGNPGRMVKAGDKVQVNIGEFKSKTLTVE